jgi:cellulose synthase/poly-beta-1,6-N-acetylglucosamine synthase-like glycosyltransferase
LRLTCFVSSGEQALEKLLHSRVKAAAKFFHEDSEKFWIRGVTYGTFEPRGESDYPAPERVAHDFALMREAGINTVRIYTAPPSYLLDEAERQGLRLIVGLTWMQHVCFLDDPQLVKKTREQVRREVRACADHSAVLAFAIGNEIHAQIVRWHGVQKIQRFLKQLYDDVKQLAPHKLVTYVNYPPTDYLDLSFLDFVSFNVFLHHEADFKAYLAKLHNIAGNRPLILTELGMDSVHHGEDEQSRFLDWQLREAYKGGAGGVCVFSWTDDWYRGGNQITDWAFGLVDAKRNPKPAYTAVRSRFARVPFEAEEQKDWPRASVVICAYNAASTIEDNLDSLARLNYPNYEVIVVNDGSQDDTAQIVAKYPFKLISVRNGGLSAARNLGWRAATGEIVAYTDADTRVDPDWLSYLVQPFLTTDAVGVGGPNVVPGDDGWISQCVARSPGGPTHVLLNDTEAEHIPGCNMAFRRCALAEVGGFDPTYTKAGDDVDICWRLQERGWHLAFSPSALVWHHHRNSVRAYWRQQVGYGEGESFLEHRHQEKFNERGQTRWQGRIYSHLPAYRSLFRSVIYHGRWGSAAFPSVYQGVMDNWTCLPQMVEWQAATALALVSAIFTPWMFLLASLMITATVVRCIRHAWTTKIDDLPGATSTTARMKHRLMIAWLHYIQLWARLRGRIKGYFSPNNVTPEGRRLLENAPWLPLGDALRLLFYRLDANYWDTRYTLIDDFLLSLRKACEAALAPVRCDTGWQQEYDLHVRACRSYSFKIKVTAEDHGGLKRLFRARLKLHRPWRFFAETAAATAMAGHTTHLLGGSWLLTVVFALSLALILVLRQVSKRGGQVVAALEFVAQELKLYSIARTEPVRGDEKEPAQDVGC